MKNRFFITIAVLFCVALSSVAQTTALVVYDGGYFVKNGKEWVEYRPGDKIGPWNEYVEYNENDRFYYIRSKRCNVAVPKIARDKILVDRKKRGAWEVVYNTISVHPICPYKNGLFYCYTTSSTEYDGYFVRDNDKWIEFRPNMKREAWAEFKQTGEDENFFILKSEHNTVYVPKSMNNRFVIKKNGNNSWRGGYTTSAIYDRSAMYDYNLIYRNTFTVKREKDFRPATGSSRVSFDRNGNVQVATGGRFYDFKYRSIKHGLYNNTPAIHISIDDKNNIWIVSKEQCVVDCRSVGKKMSFSGSDNKAAYNEIREIFRINPIIFWGE